MQDDIKKFRLETDKFINSTKFLKGSREISLAHTNLQRGKMWLGKALGELGGPTPYTQSENPANTTIEPQADHDESNLPWDSDLPHTGQVKYFRSVLQEYTDRFKKYVEVSANEGTYLLLYLQTSLLSIEEAKMWFGWELDRIRNEKQNDQQNVKAERRTTGLSFGQAIEHAKSGGKVARTGWNGQGMFAYIVPANSYPAQTEAAKSFFGDKLVPYREYWALKTAQGDVAMWSPSGSDSLADDWCIID